MQVKVRFDDKATPALEALTKAYGPRAVNAAAAVVMAETIQQHLIAKNAAPNKLGGKKTGFYAAAAKSTNFEATATAGVVYIAKDGFAQRYYGGRIAPVKAKALTIPVHPAAYGKRASEFKELRFVAAGKGNTVGFLQMQGDSQAPILYVLVKSVTQKPDPSVLPTDEQLAAAALEGVRNLPTP